MTPRGDWPRTGASASFPERAGTPAGPSRVCRPGGAISETAPTASGDLRHPRAIRWLGTTALGMGGSNQSLFLISALLVSQGSAAVLLLIVGLLLSWAALPG